MTTTVITRLFADADAAEAARERLLYRGLPRGAVQVVAAGSGGAEALPGRLERALVHDSAVASYAEAIAAGGAALVVRATARPLGAPRITRETLAKLGAAETAGVTEEHVRRFVRDPAPSVLKDHPRFLTLVNERQEIPIGRLSDTLGLPMVWRRKPAETTLLEGAPHVSRRFWPMPLLRRDRIAASAIPGGRLVSRRFWPMAHVTRKERRLSVIPGGGPVFSRRMGWRTVTPQD